MAPSPLEVPGTPRWVIRRCLFLGTFVLSATAFPLYVRTSHRSALSLLEEPQRYPALRFSSEVSSDTATVACSEFKPCFYRAPSNGRWEPRIHLSELKVGQHLTGKVVQELLDGKTGPKLFFECGVGRTDDKGDWHIMNGMMRLGGRGSKASVTRKRATRLRRKSEVDLYVSRIQPESVRLEVCATPEEAERYQGKPKIPASTLVPGQELTGTVTRVLPYGVFVDVGANRSGLLHIQKVADLYGKYIDKEAGLVDAGLERGAKIRVAVASNERKRLFLDFTPDVKEAAAEDQRLEDVDSESPKAPAAAVMVQDAIEMSEEEAAAWAAYAGDDGDSSNDDQGEEDDDEYDEDSAIEDALGLGTY